MEFINEQYNLTIRATYFLHHPLHTFFEFTTILGTRDQPRHVESNNTLVGEDFRHIAFNNPHRQAFGNRGLTNTWLTNENRIVLGSPGKNLYNTLNFRTTADNWIQFVFLGHHGVIASVFIQCWRTTIRATRCSSTRTSSGPGRSWLLILKAPDFTASPIQVNAKFGQNTPGKSIVFTNKT